MITLTWKRPHAKYPHAYEPGATISLCASWLNRGEEIPTPHKDEACRACWNKAQAKRYRPRTMEGTG